METLKSRLKKRREKKIFYIKLSVLLVIIAIILGILLFELFNQPYKIKRPKPYGDWTSTFKNKK